MGRRRRCRRTGFVPAVRLFAPCGVPVGALRGVVVAADELEAMRLVDGLGLTQEEAAGRLGVSKATVCRMVGSARSQVVRALTSGMAIRIGDADEVPTAEMAAPLRLGRKNGCCRRRNVCLGMDALDKDVEADAAVADRDAGSAAGTDPAAEAGEEVGVAAAKGPGSRRPLGD
ncbi:MAG: uncharacterized protein PWQ64_1880 [Desulfomicrobiaceae bacterium]|nr:uncharacterized protein [Desulfomicrobiaceae bacterium]